MLNLTRNVLHRNNKKLPNFLFRIKNFWRKSNCKKSFKLFKTSRAKQIPMKLVGKQIKKFLFSNKRLRTCKMKKRKWRIKFFSLLRIIKGFKRYFRKQKHRKSEVKRLNFQSRVKKD